MDMIPIIVTLSKLSFEFHVWLDGMKMRDRKFWWWQVTKEGLCLELSLYCIESYPLPCPHDQFPLCLLWNWQILPYLEAESWGLTYLSILRWKGCFMLSGWTKFHYWCLWWWGQREIWHREQVSSDYRDWSPSGRLTIRRAYSHPSLHKPQAEFP